LTLPVLDSKKIARPVPVINWLIYQKDKEFLARQRQGIAWDYDGACRPAIAAFLLPHTNRKALPEARSARQKPA
tara:strand:+ start:2565 stop:2786 length:222 start_codon:yes stop_codon:yes gene_type:complete